jgi:hypothetical protein
MADFDSTVAKLQQHAGEFAKGPAVQGPADDAEQAVSDVLRLASGDLKQVLIADVLDARRELGAISRSNLDTAQKLQNFFLGAVGKTMSEPDVLEAASATKILTGDQQIEKALGAKVVAANPPESFASILAGLAAGIEALNAATRRIEEALAK